MMCFYDQLKGDGLTTETKNAIEARLHKEGFEDVTWNGIRTHITFFTMSEAATPKGNGKWANPAFLEALLVAFYGVAKENLNKEVKDALVDKVHTQGFQDVTWEAIRLITMSRNLMRWTSEVDQHILVAMVKTMNPTSEQYDAILNYLEPCGYNFTVSALKTYFIMAPSTVWDDKAHADLLFALLSVIKPTKEAWDQVLAVVHAKGYIYTSGAVMQHLQKLQKKEVTASADGDGGASAASTPAKTPKKAATPRKRKTPAKKVKSEDDNNEDEEQPAKKPRTPSRPS
ncbi:uncharacterized protein CTRU02_203757 [Colletotrichum truncatum]|uniref:Uncharacterized protein n=1 Tax=Colletotrichum truncatum TaxID=5467 RepID=A0ACC3ZA34_COLTU|nr:uncharacterized protein CTRU02_04089 [Colletotrichum truncatum]KAF6796128.1 hypothetical protein CTRU02_04089 [Colletotrichum truncatum]